MRRPVRTDWYALRDEVEAAVRSCRTFPSSVRIDGRLERLGAGLSHENYLFWLTRDESPSAKPAAYVLRKARRYPADASHGGSAARLRTEARTLQRLASLQLGFDTPRFVCFVDDTDAQPSGFIETAVSGFRLDELPKTAEARGSLIDTIARAAAAVHRLPASSFPQLSAHVDSRAHVLCELERFAAEFLKHDPDAAAVANWVRDHLTEDRPATLLHGDLLPQNVRRDVKSDRAGVIDWEYAKIGDPAYDLAIVTRGSRRPHGCPNGLRRLVARYREAGGAAITTSDVVMWELLLVLHWLEQSVRAEQERKREGHPPEYWRNQLRSILRRAAGG